MIVLDENIPESQLHLLRGWRIRARQIGVHTGRAGMSDDQIVPHLRTLDHPTFFTRDRDFLQPWLCHPAYCLVYLDVGQYEVASFVRRVLRHPQLNTKAKRASTVIRAGHDRLTVWRRGQDVQRLAG
jgi:hypothetical protein